MRTKVLSALLALALPVFGGCGGGSSAAPSVVTPTPLPVADRAVVTMTLPTGFVTPTPSGDPDFPFLAQWDATLMETAGLGGNVNFYTIGFGGSTFPPIEFDVNWVIRAGGTNHLQARGSLKIPMAIEYRLGFGQTVAVEEITVDFTDDHGHNMQLKGTVTTR